MRLDAMLDEVWLQLPSFLKVRPLEGCITDEPLLVMGRFSLCPIYHKGRCVLFRQYLTEGYSNPGHDHARQSCLRAALALMEFQRIRFEATRPGATLSPFTWFLRPVIIGDFLLAAMIVYIALQRFSSKRVCAEDHLLNRQELQRVLLQSR